MRKRILVLALLAMVLLLTPGAAAAGDGWTPAAVTGGESVAIQTFVHSEYGGGAVRLEFDWRDNTGDVIRFRCVNNGQYALWGGAYQVDPVTNAATLLWEGTCQPGQTVSYNVNRFNFAWDISDSDGDGEPDGGLMMGDIQIRTRYPAQ